MRIIRLDEVIQRTGIKRSTIYAEMAKGRFPRQVAISTRSVGWNEEDINQWIQNKIDNATQKSD